MSYLTAIVMGLIQGIAEFLPISSSGHLAIFQNFFGMSDIEHDYMLFDVLLHLGTLIAVFVAYWGDIVTLVKEFFTMVHLRRLPAGQHPDYPARRMIVMLIVATLPLFLVLPVKDHVESLYSNTFFVGFALIVTGLMLFFSDRMRRGTKTERNATMLDAIIVGFGQALAVVPGISRSGTTIAVGMVRKFDREYAVRFSFLLSIPAVLGANILSLACSEIWHGLEPAAHVPGGGCRSSCLRLSGHPAPAVHSKEGLLWLVLVLLLGRRPCDTGALSDCVKFDTKERR